MAETLPLTGINHISRQVRDVAKSQAFYQDVMGFQPLKRPSFRFPGAWLFRDGLQVHLIGDQEMDELDAEINSRANHVAFHSDDLDAVEQNLIEHGVVYRVNIQDGTGNKQIFFHDPDGHTIEVATYPEPQMA